MRPKLRSAEFADFDLSGFFWNSSDLMCIAGHDGYFKKVNPAFVNSLGYSEEELLSQPYINFVYPEDLSKTTREATDLTDSMGNLHFENRYICKDGSLCSLSWKCTVVGDIILATARNITALKQSEDIFKKIETERQYQELANSMPQIVWIAQPDGKISYYNNRWYEFTGFEQNQPDNGNRNEILHPEDFENFNSIWNSAIQRGEPYEIEYRFQERERENYRWFLERGVPIYNSAGKLTKWYGTCTDIHEQKIANHKRRAAEEASKLKSEFLANMSHEVRTPLNGVVGMTNLLLQTKLTEDQKEYARLIVESAHHLQYVVNDILDLSKIESNFLKLDSSEVDIKELVQTACMSLLNLAEQKGIQFAVTFDLPSSFYFAGDSMRIRQVVFNLVQNAIKFTHSGSVQVHVSARSASASEKTVRFEVHDTGIGIEENALQSIFNPFVQADSSITREFGGTGLGLSICKNLVQLMGGSLNVNSQLGKGSLFYFELPVTVSSAKARTSLTQNEYHETEQRTSTPLNILVAEDHVINQKVIAKILNKFGHRPVIVSNGEAALAALEHGNFNLVLMDCHMPQMDGFLATSVIRESRASFAGIPIIALTADALEETKNKCHAAGMNGYVSKPIDMSLLFNEIEQFALLEKNLDFNGALNMNAIKKLRYLNTSTDDFALELVTDFLVKTPAKIVEIQKYLLAHDTRSVFGGAHALKSVAAAVGADAAVAACIALERAAKAGLQTECELAFSELNSSFEKLSAVLRAYLKENKIQLGG